MARDPRRVYQTLPGGCQAEEGTVEPVCCHLTRSNHATHTHTHTHTPSTLPSQCFPQDMGRRRSRRLPKGCGGIGVLGGLLSCQLAFSHPLQSFPPGGPE